MTGKEFSRKLDLCLCISDWKEKEKKQREAEKIINWNMTQNHD